LQIETLLAELRGTPEYPSQDMLSVLIKKVFGSVPSLSAVFAAAELQGMLAPGTGRPLAVYEAIRKLILDGRDDVAANKEFGPKHQKKEEERKAAAAAAAAEDHGGGGAKAKGKAKSKADPKGKAKAKAKGDSKGKDSKGHHPDAPTCSYCKKVGHTAETCWYNPDSPVFRGPKTGSPSRSGAAADAYVAHTGAASSSTTVAGSPAGQGCVSARIGRHVLHELGHTACPWFAA